MKIRYFLKSGLLHLSGMLMAIAAVAATAGTVTDDGSWLTTTIPDERVTQALNQIWQKPAAETATVASQAADGGFLEAGQDWDDTQRTVFQSSLDGHSEDLSMRFFHFLRSSSPFPQPYAYLFILLVLALAVKFLELPFLFKIAKFSLLLPSLRNEIEFIQNHYRDDPQTGFQRMQQLFRENGISPGTGCAVAIIDLIFVIWALVALSHFSSHFSSDDARFFSIIPDVTEYSFKAVILWLALTYVQFLVTGASQSGLSPSQASCGFVLNSVVIGVIAWYWDWPAYVFIFWTLLTLVGMLVNILLRGIWAATGQYGKPV